MQNTLNLDVETTKPKSNLKVDVASGRVHSLDGCIDTGGS